jgi:hypothetical protein
MTSIDIMFYIVWLFEYVLKYLIAGVGIGLLIGWWIWRERV